MPEAIPAARAANHPPHDQAAADSAALGAAIKARLEAGEMRVGPLRATADHPSSRSARARPDQPAERRTGGIAHGK